MPPTGLVLDDCYMRHDTGAGHPERAERIAAVERALFDAGLTSRCAVIEPVPVPMPLLLRTHQEQYVERVQAHCRDGSRMIDCADSAIGRASFEVAMLAAGAVVRAVDRVASGELNNAFCAVRPPGHHAEWGVSMGFCLFNNIAVAARHLRESHGVDRILIVDWDVHHGNGTQHMFEEDPQVFYCSFHGHPATLYPGTGFAEERGRGAGEGTTLNLPFMPGAGDAEYRDAFVREFLPAARSYRPEFILLSAGFDAHRCDPLANINLETSGFEWLTRELLALADEQCADRIVSVLEGGYDLQALGESAVVHVRGLIDA